MITLKELSKQFIRANICHYQLSNSLIVENVQIWLNPQINVISYKHLEHKRAIKSHKYTSGAEILLTARRYAQNPSQLYTMCTKDADYLNPN